jgi:hypothetical protein
VVHDGFLPRAFGIDSLTYNVSGIAGPALVAVISGFASPAAALLALGAMAATGGVVLAGLPNAGQAHSARQRKPRITDALRLMTRDRILGSVTAATTVAHAGLGALPVVVVVLADRAHVPSASGWLLTAFAIGALLGSISWILRPANPRQAPAIVMASLMLAGTPLVLAAGSPALGLTAALFFVSGFFAGPLAGALFTTRQDRAPYALRAQVFTLGAGLKITAAAIGVSTAGALAHSATEIQLLLSGSCPLLGGVLGALALRVRHTGGHAPPEPPPPGGVRNDRRRRHGSWRHSARVGQRR